MRLLIYILMAVMMIAVPAHATETTDSATWEIDTTYSHLTPQQIDSLTFRLNHHYSLNYNFMVKADSLMLIPREGDVITDTCYVYDGELIAVAEIRMEPGDSIDSVWVKVAHDQMTMGWIAEHELLQGVTPNDYISKALSGMTGTRGIWMVGFIAIGIIAYILRRRKNNKLLILQTDQMQSPYPIAFVITVAVMASLYASVQNLVPEFWQEYYFHPTLNPLELPPLMASLVCLVWLTIIIFIACMDEVYRHFYIMQGITYLLELLGVSMLIYVVISQATLIYIGYPLLLFFICKVLIWNKRHNSSKLKKTQ